MQFWFTVIESKDIVDRNFVGVIPLKMNAHEYCLLEEGIELPRTGELCDALGARFTNFTDEFADPIVVVNFNYECNSDGLSFAQKKLNKKKYKKLCKHGFAIGESYYKYLVTSGSSLKDQQIWFYRADLPYPINYYGVNLAKFGEKKTRVKVNMYMGLNLSGCNKWEDFPLNRVCCLPDCKINIMTEGMYVSNDAGIYRFHNAGTGVQLIEKELKVNTHDGMGFIRKKAIPDEVRASRGGVFQFRGPWVKGLLRELPDKYWHGTYTDVWGNEVNLEDMDIIFTDSVFKGACGYNSMSEFISYAPKFGYVVPSFRKRKFNYQILLSLGLTHDEYLELASEDIEYFTSLIDCSEEEEFNWKLIDVALNSLSQQATEIPDAKRVRDAVGDYLKGKKNEILSKHFNTRKYKAFNAYLQSDPDYYFTHTGMLKHGEVCDKRFDDGEWIAIARNPHVSVSEWVLAKNKITPNAVLGAIDLPAESSFAQTLSGADFDGDQVLVTNHPVIINALLDEERYEYNGIDMRCKPILFEEPEKNNVSWLEAAWSEMQNFEFSTAANNGTRSYVAFGANTNKGKYYGALFSAMMQVGVDAGKYQYVMPNAWNEVKKEFVIKKRSYPLCSAAFFSKDDRGHAESYTGIIAQSKECHCWYEVKTEEVILDTVVRDNNGTPIKQKKYMPKKCNATAIEKHLDEILVKWDQLILERDLEETRKDMFIRQKYCREAEEFFKGYSEDYYD